MMKRIITGVAGILGLGGAADPLNRALVATLNKVRFCEHCKYDLQSQVTTTGQLLQATAWFKHYDSYTLADIDHNGIQGCVSREVDSHELSCRCPECGEQSKSSLSYILKGLRAGGLTLESIGITLTDPQLAILIQDRPPPRIARHDRSFDRPVYAGCYSEQLELLRAVISDFDKRFDRLGGPKHEDI